MNVTTAATVVHVTRRTLYNWMASGVLPYTEPRPWRRQVVIADVQAVKARWYRKCRTGRSRAA